MAAKTFRNTFAPRIRGETIDVSMVIAGLRHGTIREADLPGEVHVAVSAELARIKRETISPERALVLLLGAMGEVRGRTRLQKYAFLVDMGLYSKKTRHLFTMYGWKPDKFGPHSTTLERYVRKAVREGLVREFPTYAPSGESSGYRLTDDGVKRFRELQGAFGKDILAIRDLLGKFKGDRSVDPLLAHVYSSYPEYTGKSTIRERIVNAS